MRDKRTILIVLAILIVVIGGAIFLFTLSPKEYNWYPKFEHSGTEPYDLSLFKSTLSESYGDSYYEYSNFLNDSLTTDQQEVLFVYIAGNEYLDSLESNGISELLADGASVFISSRLQHNLVEDVLDECLLEEIPDDEFENNRLIKTKKAKRIEPKLRFADDVNSPRINWVDIDEEIRYDWAYFDLEYCFPENIELVGEFNSIGETYINMVETEIGEGRLILHTNPMIFTNFHFREEATYEYVENLLSEYGKESLVYYNPEPGRRRYGGGSGSIPESPLKFILNNPPLKWAMYLFMALSIIFVLNYLRRSQRSIPVKRLPENDTANYLDVVSKLYQKDGRHKHIVAIQEKLLFKYLNQKYGLTSPIHDKLFYAHAASQLEMEEAELKQFFKEIDRGKNNSTLTDSDLFELNNKIKSFYDRCP